MKKILLILIILSVVFLFPSVGFAENVDQYNLEYKLFDRSNKSTNMGILSAVNSLDEYTRNVMLEDLEKNNKSLDDIVTITKTYNFFKRNASGD